MLKAKLDSVRKNKKGFSLIELIIVVAIMVALIAVLAPSYVKYVQKSRDAALATAAEDLYTAVKTYYADPDTDPQFKTAGGSYTITVTVSDKTLSYVFDSSKTGVASDKAAIEAVAGIDTTKKMGATEAKYIITVTYDNSSKSYTFNMKQEGALAK